MLGGVGWAGERDAYVDVALVVITVLGLSQVVPAAAALVLFRQDRASAALVVSGSMAFVPGVMILYLTLTSATVSGVLVVVVGYAASLVALGLHQLWVRSRLR